MATTAETMLQAYIDAETKILLGQEVSLNNRRLRLPDLAEVQKGRQMWQNRVNAEQAASQGGSSLYSLADFR
jgi:hypothetical protein